MRTLQLFLFLILISTFYLQAQVGIGTTSPNALLDIRSSNEAAPANTDGLLIPKIEEFPVTNPVAAQDGMLVYATGMGSVTKGFYYWEFGTTSWVAIGGVGSTVDKIDDLIDGKSDNDGTNDGSSIFLGIDAGLNDDGTDNQNVGIGFLALSSNSTGLWNSAVGYQSLSLNTTGSYNSAFGHFSLQANTTGDFNVALGSRALGNNSTGSENSALGRNALSNNIIGNGNTAIGRLSLRNVLGSYNVGLGYYAGHDETGSNKLYIENTDANPDNALIYGDFGTDNTSTGNILRTNGTFQIGNPTGTGYSFPLVDGTTNQILQTDGAGALSWIDSSLFGTDDQNISGSGLSGTTLTIGIENGTSEAVDLASLQDGIGATKIDELTDGKSDNDGTNDGSSVFLGVDAGLNDDATDNQNVGVGYQSLYSNIYGYENTADGSNTLYNNTTGYKNTAVGANALFSNTSGLENTANGASALYSNTTGWDNTANGVDALYSNTTGIQNTAIGRRALWRNTTGSTNTAIGLGALYFNTTGSLNTSNGRSSLFRNTTGIGNTANGYNALLNNTTGNYNTAVGYEALNNSTGNNNVALGFSAGYNETGSNTLYIENSDANANNALIYGEFGTDNTTTGNILRTNSELQIGNPSTTGYAFPTIDGSASQILQTNGVGALSWVNNSVIQDADWFEVGTTIPPNNINDNIFTQGNVGIGTANPSVSLEVSEDGTSGVQTIVAGLLSNTSNRPILQFSETATVDLNQGMGIEYNGSGAGTAERLVINGVGGSPLFEFRNGGSLTLRDGDLIIKNTGTDRQLIMEDDTGNNDRVLMRQTATQDIYVGDIDNNGGDVFVRAGGSTELTVKSGSGFVGINTTTPGYTLEVNGTAGKPGGGSWINSSDQRLKKNINPYQDGLETLLQIKPVRYQYNELSGFDQDPEYVGVLAQELQEIAPYMVTNFTKEGVQYLAVDNSAMTYMLINAVKMQQNTIDRLKSDLNQLRTLITNAAND